MIDNTVLKLLEEELDGTLNRNARAFPELSAAGLASKLKTDDIPCGEDSPTALRRRASKKPWMS